MKQVNIEEAEHQLGQLVDEAANGEDIVITKAGEPVARLVPVPAKVERKPRVPGALKGKIWIGDDFDAPLPPDIARAFGIE